MSDNSAFNKAMVRHKELMAEREKEKAARDYALAGLYEDISKARQDFLNEKMNHNDAIGTLFDATVEVVRLMNGMNKR